MGRTYSVKEIFYTLQGEGANTGRPAVFLRFSGCNLWSGKEEDRETAVCNFCDTDFVGTNGNGGGKFRTAENLAIAVDKRWPTGMNKLVVCTGGEPLLQLDSKAILALKERGFEVAVETNGTLIAPPELDWICVSPKIGSKLVQRNGNELKLVYPQLNGEPEKFAGLDFEHFFLQPMDGSNLARNTKMAMEYCLKNPKWRLSLQTHKILGIP